MEFRDSFKLGILRLRSELLRHTELRVPLTKRYITPIWIANLNPKLWTKVAINELKALSGLGAEAGECAEWPARAELLKETLFGIVDWEMEKPSSEELMVFQLRN